MQAEIVVESCGEGMYKALSPEMGRDLPRTSTEIRMRGDDVVITINATDSVALRAALNSHLECIMVVEDIQRIGLIQ